jgi:lysozyme
MKMKVSNSFIDKLKEFEDCRLKAYRDNGGVWTVGIGHTNNVKPRQTITMSQAVELCRDDLAENERYINNLHLPLSQGQFDALVDFSYNSGIGSLLKSRLLRMIRANINDKNIPAEFMLWAHDRSGRIENGLLKRKRFEADLWQSQY